MEILTELEGSRRGPYAGAFGYLSKDSGFQTIEDAIRRVASGRRYLSEAAQDLAPEQIQPDAQHVQHDEQHHRV